MAALFFSWASKREFAFCEGKRERGRERESREQVREGNCDLVQFCDNDKSQSDHLLSSSFAIELRNSSSVRLNFMELLRFERIQGTPPRSMFAFPDENATVGPGV